MSSLFYDEDDNEPYCIAVVISLIVWIIFMWSFIA